MQLKKLRSNLEKAKHNCAKQRDFLCQKGVTCSRRFDKNHRISSHSAAEETITAKGGIIFGNQLSARQTTKVSMEVSCQFPLDYTVTAEYPFLPQISMNIIKFNVTDYGEFSALMQLFDTDAFERPFEGSPEIEEGELLNVGVSLLDVTVSWPNYKDFFLENSISKP